MTARTISTRAVSLLVLLFALATATRAADVPATGKAVTLSFLGDRYVHRWSRNDQNEYTPLRQADLNAWRDMITINIHRAVNDGEQLAGAANAILGNYQRHGKVLRTDSKPRKAGRPAEYLMVAVLGNPGFLEAAFARAALVDGVGMVAVYSHRVYGKQAGPAMSDWLQANGTRVERAWMSWDGLPAPAALTRLPQSP